MSSDLTIFKILPDGNVEYREPAQTRVVINHTKRNIAISGSRLNVSPLMRHDVIQYTRWLILSGHTLITGGALGVDEIATGEAIRLGAKKNQIEIWLPTPLDVYLAHYRNRANEGVITDQQAENLATQLNHVNAHYRLYTLSHKECNEETYYDRNSAVLENADHLAAFQMDGSTGVQDAIDKARARHLPVTHKTYKTRPPSTEPVIIEE